MESHQFQKRCDLILEHFDDEVFLRLEHAIERDLGRVGFRRDRIDAHAANAESIEELLRRVEEPVARAAAGVARFVVEERRVRRKFALRVLTCYLPVSTLRM